MKIGQLSINIEAHKDWTKEQFIAAYKGKLNRDIESVWAEICKINNVSEIKEIAITEEPSAKRKKS